MSQQPRNPLLTALGETLESSPRTQSQQESLQQNSYNREEVVTLAKTSLDFLASLVLPDVISMAFPPLFTATWEMLTSKASLPRDFSKVALGIPRGFAKTTLMKLFIVWCILFTNKKFFLIIGATAARAENILSDIADILYKPNVKAAFGDWRIGTEKDTQ